MSNVDYVHHLAFPKLSEAEVECLAGLAKVCSFEDGETIFQAGQRGLPFYVVESGEIAIVDESAAEPKTIVVHGPGEFTGDVSLLTDRPAVVSAYARGACRAYCVSQAELRRVIQEIPDLSDKLLEAFQTRRIMLERSGFVGVRVFGHLGDPDVTVIREFFDKNKVPHTWIDADEAEGQAALQSLGVGPDQLPFVACNRGTRSPRPTVTRLAECLGLKRQIRTEPFDLVIVGAGPAGLAAAVYGASEGLATIVLDRFGPGGQAGTSSRIENYMGFPAGLTGADLANRGYLQALKFGAELVAPVEVRSMTCEDHAAPARPRRRAGRQRPDRPDRHRRRLPTPPGRRVRALGRGGDLLFLHLGARTRVPERPRRRGGRRQLGGPGGDVPRRAHRRGHAALARGRPAQEHVRLPRPPDRASPENRGHPPRRGGRRRGRPHDHGSFGSATSGTGVPATSIARRYSSSSARSPGPAGCPRASRSIPRASSSPGPMPRNPTAGP